MFGRFLKVLGAIFLVLVVVIGGLIYAGVKVTGDSRGLATEFVQHLADGRNDRAYAMMHRNFQREYDQSAFNAMVKAGGLNTIKSVGWNGFEIKNGREIISGTGETVRGEKITASITVTDIENDGKKAILGYDFAPVRE